MTIDGQRIRASFHAPSEAALEIDFGPRSYSLLNTLGVIQNAADEAGAGTVHAPMHGALLEVAVSAGETVKKGQRLAVLEAMKMQHEILAEIDGEVREVHVTAGAQIAADTVMIEIDKEDS